MSVEEIEKEMVRVKDEGNKEFKVKSFLMAGSKFTEGINLYNKYKQTCENDKNLMVKIT